MWYTGTTKSILSEKGDGKIIDHELIYWALKYSPWYETLTRVNIMQINFSLKSLDSGTGTHFSSSISIFPVNIIPTIVHSHFHLCVLTKMKKDKAWEPSKKQCALINHRTLGRKMLSLFIPQYYWSGWLPESHCSSLCLSCGQSMWDLWQTK